MNVLKSIINLLKGGHHAESDGQPVFGGGQREPVILHRIPAVCEQALSDLRDIGVLARACAAERGRDSGTLPEDPVRRESRALIAAAKSVGRYLEVTAIPGTRYSIRTGESEVRIDQKNRLYYKIKNPFAKLHLKKHPIEFVLFEHIVHNILFPDCRLEFLGVAEDLHEARFVFRQNAIRSVVRPDDRQIAAALHDLSLIPEGRYCYGNELVFVTDVGKDGDNVLVDVENQLRFVDPIIGFKAPLRPVLLTQNWQVESIRKIVQRFYGITKEEQAFIESMIKPMA